MFDKDSFCRAVTAKGLTLDQLAIEIGMNYTTLYRKMYGISDFTRAEIKNIRRILRLTPADADKIFFADKLA
jgi:hypothetical protein